jgi:ribosomal-protein-serine acetyltransferase
MFSYQIGEREELRLPEARDAEELSSLVGENLERFREWMPGFPANYATEHAREFLAAELKKYADRQSVPTSVWADERLAGFVSLKGIDAANRNASLGYFIGASFEGRGLVTRACRVLLDYAFDHLRLHRVEVLCVPANAKSRAVPERLGFTEEVTFREVQWLYDHFVDLVVYGMLEDEWREKREL